MPNSVRINALNLLKMIEACHQEMIIVLKQKIGLYNLQ